LKPAITTCPSGTSTRSTSRSTWCGLAGELQHMGQHHQIEAGGGKGQRGVVGSDLHLAAPARKRKGIRLAAGIELRQPELHRVVAEDVGHQRIEARLSQAIT
jgi:hypothetical protein